MRTSTISGPGAGPDPTGARELMVGLIQIGRAMRTRLADHEDPSEYFLLHLVETGGPIRSTDLAAMAMIDHSTVSRQVARLADRGLVRRVPDPADGRASLLALSDTGRAALDRASARRRAVLADALAGWSERDARRLISLVARLGDDLAGAPPVNIDEAKEPA